MTERLYYHDAYLREFTANVISTEGNKVYLDRTAFYPTSGGQPFDRGRLGEAVVEDVVDESDRIAHLVSGPTPAGEVTCQLDWERRFDYMQQHSGQHLLSAVFAELFGISTLSVHFADDYATMDVAAPSLSCAQTEAAQERASEIVFENRPITVNFANASDDLGLRKAVEREGELRIVSIADLDRSACGGTHVRSTAEIGPVLIRKQEKIRGSVRLEFVCGRRAVRRAMKDYEALSGIARAFSASIEEASALVRSTIERAQEAEKRTKKLAMELAQFQGRALYHATAPEADGLRRVVLREAITEDVRTRAQAFASQTKAVLIAICENPPSVLVAASKDSGVSAGELVKNAVTANGGRGGGNPAMAQGSLPDADALQRAVSALL